MRLIDGDELRHSHCVECTLYPDKCLGKDCDWGSIYHIDHAPTVEAIPISWLQTKADSWNAELKNACPEDAETIRHIQDKYLEIIEEWRKEE